MDGAEDLHTSQQGHTLATGDYTDPTAPCCSPWAKQLEAPLLPLCQPWLPQKQVSQASRADALCFDVAAGVLGPGACVAH